MEFKMLCNATEFIADVSKMIYEEFVMTSKSAMTMQDVLNFFSHTFVNQYPMTFIAIVNNQCVGTVSVFENDWREKPEYKPWLASLYVKPAYRSQKIAEQLIDTLHDHLKQLGFQEVYLKTENTSNYYINRGWKLVETAYSADEEAVDIFKYDL